MFEEILVDFSWLGMLLIIGTAVRAKVKIFQILYIPASVIAGFLGLILGPQLLGRISPFYIHLSIHMEEYAPLLLSVLFVTVFLGIKMNKKVLKRAVAVWLIATVTLCVQFLTCVPVGMIFKTNRLFSLIPQSSFFGGHGVASGLAVIWQNAKIWSAKEVISIGTTFATIGLLWGVVVGIILINIATRKGWLATEGTLGNLSEEEKSGYIKSEKRSHIILGITKNEAVNPLAYHIAFVFGLMSLSFGLLKVIKWLSYQIEAMRFLRYYNVMVPALIVSLVVGIIVNKTELSKVCDVESVKHIGNTALEFLIVSSVANTNLEIVRVYGIPIFVCSILGLLFTSLVTLGLAKYWIKTNWFEHGIMMMGGYTGVLATGLMLLRVVDSEFQTDASTDVVSACPIWILLSQNFFLSIAPIMAITATGFTKLVLITVVILLVSLFAGTVFLRGN